MITIYRCSECGEDYKHESPTAEISNIGTVNELIYHLDPCPVCCTDSGDKIAELEQENAKLKAKLHNIEEGVRRLDEMLKSGSTLDHDGMNYLLFSGHADYDDIESHTFADLIDKILTGGK